MKTKSFLIAALMVIGVAVANAQSVVVERKSSTVFKIMYREKTAGKVKMSIFNAAGTEVFAETFKEVKSFARPLNFVGMEQGEYTVELVDNNGKKVEKINEHYNHDLIFHKDIDPFSFHPIYFGLI